MMKKIEESSYDSSDFPKMTNEELMYSLKNVIWEIVGLCAGNKLSELFAKIFLGKMIEEFEKRLYGYGGKLGIYET